MKVFLALVPLFVVSVVAQNDTDANATDVTTAVPDANSTDVTTSANSTDANSTEETTAAPTTTAGPTTTTTTTTYYYRTAETDCDGHAAGKYDIIESLVESHKFCGECHNVLNVTTWDPEACQAYGLPDRANSYWVGGMEKTPWNFHEEYLDDHGDITECECVQKCSDDPKCAHAVYYGEDMWFQVEIDSDGDGFKERRFFDVPARCMLTMKKTCQESNAGGTWRLWHKDLPTDEEIMSQYEGTGTIRKWDDIGDSAQGLVVGSFLAVLLARFFI